MVQKHLPRGIAMKEIKMFSQNKNKKTTVCCSERALPDFTLT